MILALDTSLADLRIALFDESGAELAAFHYVTVSNERGVHDRLLADETQKLFRSIGASPKDISRIAYISGPGSFTGLRIGLSFIKGIAYSVECSLLPVTAHQMMMREYEKIAGELNDVLFLYPGYEKNSYYAAQGENIDLIRFLKHDVLDISDSKKYAGHFSLKEILPELIPLKLPLGILAEMAIEGKGLLVYDAIAELEPFYGTDFKPTVGRVSNPTH